MRPAVLVVAALATPSAMANAQTARRAAGDPVQPHASGLTPSGPDVPLATSQVQFSQAGSESIHHHHGGDLHTPMGRTWKAQFDENGVTIVPFLGSDASRNYLVTFRVVEVLHGTTAATVNSPAIDCAGDRMTLDRGAIRSEYVLDHQGIEQLFVLPEPTGAGPLTVSVEVTTGLQALADGAG